MPATKASPREFQFTAEEKRLQETREGGANWRKWGPYLAERAWGTVREDYSAGGTAWDYFPHDHARSRVYRWNEDGLAGICDEHQFLCFSVALWNGKDTILKERLFGLNGEEGNHGEDVKELYYYLDNTPSHAYMKCLYKYPQAAFPYEQLVAENGRRDRSQPEYELLDSGVFDEDRYFDVVVEYAKASPNDLLISISVTNHGPEAAGLSLLPTLWFRNTWAWGSANKKPGIKVVSAGVPTAETNAVRVLHANHHDLGDYYLYCEKHQQELELLFCDNETNTKHLFNTESDAAFFKDGINNYVVNGEATAINPAETGTKAAAHYKLSVAHGVTETVRLRLCKTDPLTEALETPYEHIFSLRRQETNDFYATIAPEGLSEDAVNVQRQALAGLLWSKQWYNLNVRKWLLGDPNQPKPPLDRLKGRNHNWEHLNNADVLSMPDTWEYPWYAAWDLAFHTIAFSLVDPDFAKDQLLLLLREWYMHPNGQLPAYEWEFGDVNPPVHAWAALRVFRIERRLRGHGDTAFLERIFHKLLINFTWWVNRKDAEGHNIFQGGFLGLDNIGVFDRSAPLPFGGRIDQSDGTSWMAMYCLNMLAIALELARTNKVYEDVATKFLEHFFYISNAMNDRPALGGEKAVDLWDECDGFYYDVLHFENGQHMFMRVRSLVGVVPLFAVETLDAELLERLPGFHARLDWFLAHRPDLCDDTASITRTGQSARRLFAVVNEDRLKLILKRLLDEGEFLSPYGIRSLSRFHEEHPYSLAIDGVSYDINYQPAESTTNLFGGNSNWRGPIWFPLNYLLIESLQKLHYYYGDDWKVEHPVGSGEQLDLWDVSTDLSQRLIRLFLRDENGRRPVFGGCEKFQSDPNFKDYIPFHEYFHGDNGAGLGASHQTGWTALVAKLIQQSGI